jgi:hypothetical protein
MDLDYRIGKIFVTYAARDLSGKNVTDINMLSLSHATMTRRVEDISSDFLNTLRNKGKEYEIFNSNLNDNNDSSDTAQLLSFILDVTESFEVCMAQQQGKICS